MRAAVGPFKRGHSLREQTHFGDSRGVAESHVLVSCHLLQEVHELRAERESGSAGRTLSGAFYINTATLQMQERADFRNQLRVNTKKKKKSLLIIQIQGRCLHLYTYIVKFVSVALTLLQKEPKTQQLVRASFNYTS